LLGIDLHRISLGALIIALGLLVDDAIIVVEMMTVKLEQGWERSAAASHAYTSTAAPRLIGALVTCCGFIPVAFSIGAAAEFVGSLFWVVTMALLISWLVAGTATPLLGYSLIKAKPHDQYPSFDLYDTKFYRLFKKILNWCLTHRKLVLSLTLAVFLVSLVLMTFVKQEFFPASVRPELIVDLKLPEGSSIQSTEAQANKLAERLKSDPDIVNYAYYVGQSAPRFVLNAEPVLPCSNFAQFVILAKDYEARVRLQARCEQLIARELPSVYGHCRVLGIGPQSSYPVVFRISGPDNDKVKDIAHKVQTVMASQPYLRDVNLNWSQKNKVVHLEIDQDKARMLGIDNQSLASILQAQLSGIPIAEFREKDRTISMTVRLDGQGGKDLSVLKDLNVPLSNGKYVPLDQIARISYDAEDGLIWRRALQPTITAQSEINGDMTAKEATKRVEENIKDIRTGLPTGYSIEVGGNEELSKDALKWLMQPVPVMIIIIILLLMIQLESIPKMLMTLATAPLGLIGVSLALLITRSSLGFVAVCGVLALAGIIIRNSVVLIDQIEQQLQAGESVWDAIVHATVQRFRPIMLTAGAAILGMVPLATSVFWGPMAIALAGGLFIATVLTLIVLPVMYAAWYKAAPPVETGETVAS
ncbi:MAG: efflux RND transporter permease subunit, partial [Desulfocucumaceae bacterium]